MPPRSDAETQTGDQRALLDEQIAYYRARVPEFDEWYAREGFNDFGERWNAQWFAEMQEMVGHIDAFAPRGKVLDLACGTGWWTKELLRHSSDVVAIDSSPEALEVAAGRAPGARFVRADLFEWEPDDTYDTIFFGFWMSHVPADRFEAFWTMLDRALAPDGRVFFIDNLGRPLPDIPREAVFWKRERRPDGVTVRRLNDGSEYRIVKHYFEIDELRARLASLGWDVDVRNTEWFFIWGSGGRSG
jgi:demethylmenaquinone methyltransferase/2-methoxy-6-polyprenyl-1,4-benzoquinol methylase